MDLNIGAGSDALQRVSLLTPVWQGAAPETGSRVCGRCSSGLSQRSAIRCHPTGKQPFLIHGISRPLIGALGMVLATWCVFLP